MKKLNFYVLTAVLSISLLSCSSSNLSPEQDKSYEEILEIGLSQLTEDIALVVPPISSPSDEVTVVIGDNKKLKSAMTNLGWTIELDGDDNGRLASGTNLSAAKAVSCAKKITDNGGCAYVRKTGGTYTVKEIPCK